MIFNLSDFNSHWQTKKLEQLGTFKRGKSKHRPRNDEKLFENGIVQKYNSFVEDRHGNIRTVIFNKSLCIYNEKKIGIVGLITDSSEKQDYSLIL